MQALLGVGGERPSDAATVEVHVLQQERVQ